MYEFSTVFCASFVTAQVMLLYIYNIQVNVLAHFSRDLQFYSMVHLVLGRHWQLKQ